MQSEIWFSNGCAILSRQPVINNDDTVTFTNDGPHPVTITEISLSVPDFGVHSSRLVRPWRIDVGQSLNLHGPILE